MENLNSVCFINRINKIEPIDGHDHGWSAARYALMSHELDNLSVDFE